MKIGILGGTFNPIHLGHTRLAREARDKLALDKVILVPSYMPPHKSGKEIISSDDRYAMAKIALSGTRGIEVSDIEMKLKGTSYSINTVRKIKDIYGEAAEIYLITGSDYAGDLDSWMEIDRLRKMCTLTIATRPGSPQASGAAGARILRVETPEISSSDIRRRIKEGKDFKDLVCPRVYDYIEEHGLYR
jgi:nicotinate-nucleotide adenylyltransferase